MEFNNIIFGIMVTAILVIIVLLVYIYYNINTRSLLNPNYVLKFNKYRCIELIPTDYTEKKDIIFDLKINNKWYGTNKANKWIFDLYNDDANYLFYKARDYITDYINNSNNIPFIKYLTDDIVIYSFMNTISFTYDDDFIYFYDNGNSSKPMYCINIELLDEFKNKNTNKGCMFVYED